MSQKKDAIRRKGIKLACDVLEKHGLKVGMGGPDLDGGYIYFERAPIEPSPAKAASTASKAKPLTNGKW